ncbi:hypothetical protein ACB092_06G092900 [Castanea dentata]
MFLLFISQTHNDSDSSTIPIQNRGKREVRLTSCKEEELLSWVCDGKVRAETSRWVCGVGRRSGPVTLSFGWAGGDVTER